MASAPILTSANSEVASYHAIDMPIESAAPEDETKTAYTMVKRALVGVAVLGCVALVAMGVSSSPAVAVNAAENAAVTAGNYAHYQAAAAGQSNYQGAADAMDSGSGWTQEADLPAGLLNCHTKCNDEYSCDENSPTELCMSCHDACERPYDDRTDAIDDLRQNAAQSNDVMADLVDDVHDYHDQVREEVADVEQDASGVHAPPECMFDQGDGSGKYCAAFDGLDGLDADDFQGYCAVVEQALRQHAEKSCDCTPDELSALAAVEQDCTLPDDLDPPMDGSVMRRATSQFAHEATGLGPSVDVMEKDAAKIVSHVNAEGKLELEVQLIFQDAKADCIGSLNDLCATCKAESGDGQDGAHVDMHAWEATKFSGNGAVDHSSSGDDACAPICDYAADGCGDDGGGGICVCIAPYGTKVCGGMKFWLNSCGVETLVPTQTPPGKMLRVVVRGDNI